MRAKEGNTDADDNSERETTSAHSQMTLRTLLFTLIFSGFVFDCFCNFII